MKNFIRPEIIAHHHSEAKKAWEKRTSLIAARDDEYRALNAEFGGPGTDGSVTSSYIGQGGPQYHARYQKIGERFQPHYDAVSAREYEFRQGLRLTVAEFLFLDNFYGPLLDRLCADKRFAQSHRVELLRMKAAIVIDDWKEKENVGGIYARIEEEIRLFPYAAKRCRDFLMISLFHLSSNRAIRQFKREWAAALHDAIDRIRLV